MHLNILVIICSIFFYLPDNSSLSKQKEQETSIVGRWGLCKSGDDEHQITDNICREIHFSEDGSGIIIYPSGEQSGFLWNMKKTSIEFSFKSDKDRKEFFSETTTFKYEVSKTDSSIYLKLIDSDYWYLLNKAK